MKKTRLWLIIILVLSIGVMPLHAQDVVSDLLGRINNLRASLGLSAYTLNPALMAAAQSHAQWMVDTSSVSHVEDNGSRPVDRAQANGYASSWVSENIYMGSLATVNDAWNFWINSPIHYAGLTSANFDHIGIGTAKGAGGQSFVLVFGNSGASRNTRSNNASANNNSGNGNAPAAPPPGIKGNDAFGNIQYEIQAGDTLGDVLLLFGYTWDELPALMELNKLTDADISSLKIGEVILVPPVGGTWTPTPAIEETSEATEPAPESTEVSTEIIEPTVENSEVVAENTAPTAENGELLGQPVTFNGASSETEIPEEVATVIPNSATPLPSPTMTQAIVISTPITGIIPTPIPENTTQDSQIAHPPAWLVGAIVVQVAVLIYAAYELIRRWRG